MGLDTLDLEFRSIVVVVVIEVDANISLHFRVDSYGSL